MVVIHALWLSFCHGVFSSIIVICWRPKGNVFIYFMLYSYAQFIWPCSMACCLLLYHIHVFFHYRFLLMHRGCLSMQHAWLLILHISWEGTLLPTACCGNNILYIMYIILCFMVICSYFIALYSSVTPAFSCTESKIPKWQMSLACLNVHLSQNAQMPMVVNSCAWLFKYYHDFTCFTITIRS